MTTENPCDCFPENCDVVRFQVVSSDASQRTAIGEIRSRPACCGIDDIPDTAAGGTVIHICDPGGCFFNEPNETLIGRMGWAKYMNAIDEICDPESLSPSRQWEVFSLCCQFPECGEA